MILVAGLAIAGLAGIAAAFYFSVRPGKPRVRGAGPGRPGAERPPARSAMTPSRTGRSRPDPDADFGGPSGRRDDAGHLAAGHRVHRGAPAGPTADHTAPRTVPVSTRRAAGVGSQPRRADRPDREAVTPAQAVRAQAHAQAPRSRRRVGWHKGSELDEEMWPTESFGGVSDEQFWDDLASDKPLATTARTAGAPDPGPRRRLPEVVPVRDVDDRGRGDRGASSGSGAYSPPAGRSGPADRTVIQPVRTGPQPIQTGAQPIHSGPQPIQSGHQPTPAAARSYQPATQPQPYQAAPSYQPATQPSPIAGQTGRGGLPTDPRGRARLANGTDAGAGAGAHEDPLTSSAYSLRPPGAVDGRSQSSRRSRDLSREQYEAALSQETQTFSLADVQAANGGYPGGVPPFRQFDSSAGGGNGRAPEHRPGGGRSDTSIYDGLRSDRLRSDAYRSGGRPDSPRGAETADPYGSTAGHPYPERPYSDPAPSAATSSYGDAYGYGYPVSPVDDPRQSNGTRGHGRSGANGNSGARHAYPASNGHRSPYDPRMNGRG